MPRADRRLKVITRPCAPLMPPLPMLPHLKHALLARDVWGQSVSEGVFVIRSVEPGDCLLDASSMGAERRSRGQPPARTVRLPPAAIARGNRLPVHAARLMTACTHRRWANAGPHLNSHGRHWHRPSVHGRPGVRTAAIHAAHGQGAQR